MGTPYTDGKHGTNPEGGHTSIGIHRPEGNKTPATSNDNTRIGDLDERTQGMGCDTRKP